MEYLDDRNNTNFPKELREAIKKIKFSDDDPLGKHQRIVVEYISKSPTRGLMLLHKMGTGKSISALAIAHALIILGYKVMFISNKSLHSNFDTSIDKYFDLIGQKVPDDFRDKIDYITYNASNMMVQIKRVAANLENRVIIFDEAHNFFNSITNGSEKAIALYDLIMATVNCKIIFLTGTGMINDPFEIALGFNMLSGKINGYELFGDDYETFSKYFVADYQDQDVSGNPDAKIRIKNREKFKQRIVGLASVFKQTPEILKYFPKAYPMEIVKVPMSDKQYILYSMARDSEMEEALNQEVFTQKAKYKKPSGGSSSYRIKSRQISNGVFPDSEIIRKEGKIVFNKGGIDQLWTKELLNMCSPKALMLLENLSNHLPEPVLKEFRTKRLEIGTGIIYSTFVELGVEYIAKILESFGMIRIKSLEDILRVKESGHLGGTFAIQSGDVLVEDRAILLKAFVSKENIDCSLISLYLYTATGAEGMDTKNVRHSHIYESYWNWNRISQVEARAIRYKSAEDLPEDQRTVRTYLYLAILPTIEQKEMQNSDSTDMTLFKKSLQNKKLLDSFLEAIEEASIDCFIFADDPAKCFICSPNDRVLFLPQLHKDMAEASRCSNLVEEKKVAQKIIVTDPLDNSDIEFAYLTDDSGEVQIFSFSKKLNGYVRIYANHPLYNAIMEKILSLKI